MNTTAIVVIAVGAVLALAAYIISSMGTKPAENAEIKDWDEKVNEDREPGKAEPDPAEGDVSVTQTMGQEDGRVNVDLTVKSLGPATATDVVLTDDLPDGRKYKMDGADANSCDRDEFALTCNFGSIPTGETRQVSVSFKPDGSCADPIENTATVQAKNDANASNDSTTAAVDGTSCD